MFARIVLTAGLLLLIILLGTCGVSDEPQVTGVPDEALPPVAATAAERALAGRLGVPVEEVDVVSWDMVEWPDACLGIIGADEACAEVVTQGWRVVLDVDGEQYIYRTDYDGTVVRLEEGAGG